MKNTAIQLTNPYTPGAGYLPPHLAGREKEIEKFKELLAQEILLKNPIITGLRGIGKTVLLSYLQPIAEQSGWVWVGTELSESVFVSEETVCKRLITDLAFFTSTLGVTVPAPKKVGLAQGPATALVPLNHGALTGFFESQPGLHLDKLKATFEFAWPHIEKSAKTGVIFAYDEAQIVDDRTGEDQYPLSTLLALFQSLQRKGMRYLLLLAGLPTLFPKLVNSRTYSERMFSVQTLGRLDPEACREAITKPLVGRPVSFTSESVERIITLSGGYPYFIQFICRECFDHFRLQFDANPGAIPSVPVDTITAKLDSDFFAGRWASTTDRQREFLYCVASIENLSDEFSSNEIVDKSLEISSAGDINAFGKGDISQMLPKLMDKGLIYKSRYGRYSFALPMFRDFILRQFK